MGEVVRKSMSTLIMELRYSSDAGHYERYNGLVDGINDQTIILAQRFGMDILSLSHVVEDTYDREAHIGAVSITCTAVCALNGADPEYIDEELRAENNAENSRLYCFLELGYKLSVRVSKINYN